MYQTDLFSQQDNNTPKFTGSDYEEKLDKPRLSTQYEKIFKLMQDGLPRTLQEIEIATLQPQASISAQLRYMRKEGHSVTKQRRGERNKGLFEYKLTVKPITINS